MNSFTRLTSLTVLGAAALLAGCATEDYVNERTAALNMRINTELTRSSGKMTAVGDQVAALEARTTSLDERVGKFESSLGATSKMAQEAMDRASAASKPTAVTAAPLAHQILFSENRIHFSSGSAKLNKAAANVVAELVGKVKAENRSVFIEIQGHTDAVGDPYDNKMLGLDRAEAVRDALYRAGIALNQMGVISLGSTQPEAKDHKAKSRAQNRRVVVRVLI